MTKQTITEDGTVNIEVCLGAELAGKIDKMTKKEIVEVLCAVTLKSHVQNETTRKQELKIFDLKQALIDEENEVTRGRERLATAERHVEQARAMIDVIMQGWYDYDE